MSNEKINQELEFKQNSIVIEEILSSFGIIVRVTKVNDYKDCTQYLLELTVGTPIQDLLKLDKDLAICLASPTGYVEIQAPIPNSSLIGITVAKHDKYNKQNLGEVLHSYPMDFERTLYKPVEGWRGKASSFIYSIGSLLIIISAKINRK